MSEEANLKLVYEALVKLMQDNPMYYHIVKSKIELALQKLGPPPPEVEARLRKYLGDDFVDDVFGRTYVSGDTEGEFHKLMERIR